MTSSSSTVASPLAPPPLLAERPDFPTWLPAMLVKELRQGLRTRGFVGAFIIFQVIMVISMLIAVLSAMFSPTFARRGIGTGINGVFWFVVGIQLLFVTPARGFGGLRTEIETRSLDLLVLTRLTAWRIVLGKWTSLFVQALLLVVAVLPYGIIRYFMGSVDLMEDATVCAAMLVGCAVMTAAGLAASGLPKIFRGLTMAATVYLLIQGMGVFFGRRMAYGGGPFAHTNFLDMWPFWVNGLLLLGVLLVTAVRLIAPPAENHAPLTRLLALAATVPAILLSLFGKTSLAHDQWAFAMILLAVVSAVELSSMRWPMAPHWRPWMIRGTVTRVIGRFGLPGWPSAFLFALACTAVVILGCFLTHTYTGIELARGAWLTVLATTALVFPAVVLSFSLRASRSPGLLYGGVFVVSSLIAALAGILSNGPSNLEQALKVVAPFPGAGFWIALLSPESLTPVVFTLQTIVAIAVLCVGTWQSRAYWQYLRKLEAHLHPKK